MKKAKRINSKRKRNVLLRRVTVSGLFLAAAALAVLLGWQVFRGIAVAIATGDRPVSTPASTTAAPTTTTTTYPTISVSAPLASPRVAVYDVTHSAMLYSQNADQRCYPASLTKMLTAIIATDLCEPDEEFIAGSELSLVQRNSSRAGLWAGYRLTRDMIIDAMLLPSGNDAAYTVAVNVGRKITGDPKSSDLDALFAFADKMNAKAQELGAVDSHFSNPDGYYSADHYTTAADMLKIAKAAMQYDNIYKAMGKTSAQYVLLSGQKMTFKNTNKIINPKSSFYYEGATGMKTGSTNESGFCIAASAKRNGVEIITIIMGSISNDSRYVDAIALFNEAFNVGTTTAAMP